MYTQFPKREDEPPVLQYEVKHPGGSYELVLDVRSIAVVSDRPSAEAAASHSLLLEMRAPPQEPLSIM